MPRPKSDSASEPKKRSRTGCWPCKARKVKCGEEKPQCQNCIKNGETCDYSIRLNWGGRSRKDKDGTPTEPGSFTFVATPSAPTHAKSNSGHEHVFSAQHIAAARPARPHSSHGSNLPTPEPTPSGEAPMLDPRLRFQAQGNFHPPSLQHSQTHPSNNNHVAYQFPTFPDTHPRSNPQGQDFRWSPQHGAKRVKLDPARSPPTSQPNAMFAMPQYPAQTDQSPGSTHFTPHSISSIVNTPATPGSSINSGSPYPQHQNVSGGVQDAPDLRRLSVKSLLSDPSDEPERPAMVRGESHGYRIYGFDHGFPDLDVDANNDNDALQSTKSPDLRRASAAVSVNSSSSGDVDATQIAFEPGGYYAQPVPIRIHRSLEPLPPELLSNPMNLLYFHHFINHTGRMLVPHDCPENPFRTVLPQIAVRNQQLLHLFLAFSASHRARLLHHREPSTRIARWMEDVLPALLKALSEPTSPGVGDPADPSSLAPLATAIMLSSLEIISPDTFAVSIPWQQHLGMARRMIVAKGGLDHLAQKADGARDKAIFFLSRWFAYLDVLGSLSGSQQEQPLTGAYLEDGGGMWLVNRGNDEIYQIDCFFGFSGRCISLLAQVAELAAQCDAQRVDRVAQQVRPEWKPSQTMRHEAEELEKRIQASATMVYRGCAHQNPLTPQSPESSKTDTVVDEIFATNEAYHWAGLIHLYRRVLAHPSTSPKVQENVHRILDCLAKVRQGSSAESCLLFPMFTAGAEAQTREEREAVIKRLRAVERWGMHNVVRARELMERVWREGRPWEVLVDGEFFG